jgi:hypothetical protein
VRETPRRGGRCGGGPFGGPCATPPVGVVVAGEPSPDPVALTLLLIIIFGLSSSWLDIVSFGGVANVVPALVRVPALLFTTEFGRVNVGTAGGGPVGAESVGGSETLRSTP